MMLLVAQEPADVRVLTATPPAVPTTPGDMLPSTPPAKATLVPSGGIAGDQSRPRTVAVTVAGLPPEGRATGLTLTLTSGW